MDIKDGSLQLQVRSPVPPPPPQYVAGKIPVLTRLFPPVIFHPISLSRLAQTSTRKRKREVIKSRFALQKTLDFP